MMTWNCYNQTSHFAHDIKLCFVLRFICHGIDDHRYNMSNDCQCTFWFLELSNIHFFFCLRARSIMGTQFTIMHSCNLNTITIIIVILVEPGHGKMCLMPYANNKGADQLMHPRCLISALKKVCFSLPRQNDTSSLYIRNFKVLAGLCI